MPSTKTYHRKNLHKTSSRLSSRKRKKVTFLATKTVKRRQRVSFTTRSGKSVSFVAKQEIPKRVKVKFYAKKHK